MRLQVRALLLGVGADDHLHVGREPAHQGENRARLVCIRGGHDHEPRALRPCLHEHLLARGIARDDREPAHAHLLGPVAALLHHDERDLLRRELVGHRRANPPIADEHRVSVELRRVHLRRA